MSWCALKAKARFLKPNVWFVSSIVFPCIVHLRGRAGDGGETRRAAEVYRGHVVIT